MAEQTPSRRPLPELDLLRLLAAFFVVLLHVLSPVQSNSALFGTRTWWAANFLNEIARAGVPLFLMLTGALLLPAPATRDFAPFYRRRMGRILLPFLCWDIIYYLVYRLAAGEPVFSRAFFDELLVQGSVYHLWYVYTLTGIYLVLPFLARAVGDCTNRQLFWLIVLIAFPTTLRPLLNLTLPSPFYLYLFDPLLEGYLGYVLLGVWLSRIKLSRATAAAIPLCGLGGIVMGACFNYFRSSPDALDLYFNGGYTLNHYLLAAALFLAARHLAPRLPDSPCFIRRVRSLSALTYEAYLAHVLVLALLDRLLPLPTPALEIIVWAPLAYLISMALAWCIQFCRRWFGKLLPAKC